MSNTPYKRTKELIRVSQFKAKFVGQYGKVIGPEDLDNFPEWVWPYIRRLYKAGKLTKDLQIPEGAKPEDYPLVTLPALKKAGVAFPGYEFGEFPKDFQKLVKNEVSAKHMDAYGKVTNPEVLPKIPVPLWPYIRTTGTIGSTVGLLIKGENPDDYPPSLIKYADAIKRVK